MKTGSNTSRMICIVIFLVIMTPTSVSATILFRDTFEGTMWTPWAVSVSSSDYWDRLSEDLSNTYASQTHGDLSFWLRDPDDSSYTSASKVFDNGATEYMIEFYLWIPNDHDTIDSFPLCVLYDTINNLKTDVSLHLDTKNIPPDYYVVYLEDATGLSDSVACIDSTDRWYRIQIYRHNGVVDIYLDGDSVGTYSPLNSSHVSNKIVLGATADDSLADGEVFYDDIIISTPPVGEHPRLLFESSYLDTLRNHRNGGSTYLDVTYASIWDSLEAYANHFVTETDTIIWKKNGPNDTLVDTFSFPYRQFSFMPRTDIIEFWLGPQRRIASELLALCFVSLVDTTADSVRTHAESLLVSLSHWQMWNDPYFIGEQRQYIQLGVGHIMFSMALAYDWLYSSLSDYERLSIQNSLIALGINQTYLEATEGTWGQATDQWPNAVAVMIGGMGMSCLALDSVNLENERDAAKSRIDALLNDPDVCDSMGGFAEGISYGGYAVDHLVTFVEAEDSLGSYVTSNRFLGNYPEWRIWCMLPGAENYCSDLYYTPTYWDLTFCDYDRLGARWTTAIARIADLTDHPEARWYLRKRKDLRFSERDSKCDRWELYLPFGLFLWTDNSMETSMPAPDTLSKVFDGIGWAIMRTGWQDSDYLLGVKSGNWLGSHNHHEQGSFIFGSEGRWLIADMGYYRDREHKNASFHNVLYEVNSETLYTGVYTLSYHFEADSSYSYIQSVGDTLAAKISPWKRNIVFFNKLGSFAVMDYAPEQDTVDSLCWLIHTWVDPYIENDTIIKISYNTPDTPNLLGHVIFPKSVTTTDTLINSVSYVEKTTSSSIEYDFRRIKVDIPTTENIDTLCVVVGFAPYKNEDSVEVTSISGRNSRGAKLTNERGCAAVIFGTKDSTAGDKYEISITDSLLNVICNLVPDTAYLVISQNEGAAEKVDTVQTNEVGILTFTLRDTGDCQVLVALERASGSLQINNDSNFCNMPHVALKLHLANPFDTLVPDSMKIWQYYTDGEENQQCDSTGWIAYDSTYFWQLRQGPKVNTIYAQFMTDGWNESVAYSDSIIYDKTAPTGFFVINDDSVYTNASLVTLANEFTDTLSGVSKMRFGNEYLANAVKNSAFAVDSNWLTDTAAYHDSLELFEIPACTTGNYFYQSIPRDSLLCFYNDTLLLWTDLVSDNLAGDVSIKVQYVYAPDTQLWGPHPCGTAITIPHGTNAHVSHYNLASYFVYQPDTLVSFVEVRVGIWVVGDSINNGRMFIDNLRLDVVGPSDDYTTFDDYDTLRNDWSLVPGNGVRKVYGQFADSAGNETGIWVDSIIVDAIPPVAPNISSRKSENDIVLSWNTVRLDTSGNADTIDYYIVYRDTFPAFIPGVSDSIGVVGHPDTTFVDSNAVDYSENYYYLVTTVDCARNISAKSNMGYKFSRFFREHQGKLEVLVSNNL